MPRAEPPPTQKNDKKMVVTIRCNRRFHTEPKISGSGKSVNPQLVSKSQNHQSGGLINPPRPKGWLTSLLTFSGDVYSHDNPNNIFWQNGPN